MDFDNGELIDERFLVTGICSDSGGMGKILFVEDVTAKLEGALVLKYCREENEEYIKWFKREVRLLESFKDNSKIVNILHSNKDYEPPYFVMQHYPQGDLSNIFDEIKNDVEKQEKTFNLTIDSIAVLHAVGTYHRDIKPQNFLLDGDSLVVTDFGLGVEPDSTTRFTSTASTWGTQGYLPPEYQDGGFKNADQTGDIFMLGKSFYTLLTNQNPAYLLDNGVNPALFHVIERACDLDKTKRYQSLSELKQALNMTYDVLLGRGGELGEVNQLIATINDKLENEGKYDSTQVSDFIEKLALIDNDDQVRICLELEPPFISILTNEKLSAGLNDFLKVYKKMVESEQYGWAFAEKIANNMKLIFVDSNVPEKLRARALELAIDAAHRTNRYAAMDTCIAMISSVDNDKLGIHIAAVMQENDHEFVRDIEPAQCKCDSIRAVLRAFNKK